MDRQRTYDDLTSKQRWALQALKAALVRHGIAETISECIRLRWWGKEISDAAKADFRLAYSAGRAAQMVLSYLKYLEDVQERRVKLGRAIGEKLRHPEPSSKEEVVPYVEAELDAMEMAGMQDILMLDFANTCIQIYSLLKKAAEGCEYDIPQADLDYLNHYRPLRDHSSHIYNRLPGGPNEKEVVTEIDDERGFQIIIGYEIDNQDRVILGDKRIEVNAPGMEKVFEIGKRNLAAFSPSAIAGLHRYFVQHPENIPPPGAVRAGTLTRAARLERVAEVVAGGDDWGMKHCARADGIAPGPWKPWWPGTAAARRWPIGRGVDGHPSALLSADRRGPRCLPAHHHPDRGGSLSCRRLWPMTDTTSATRSHPRWQRGRLAERDLARRRQIMRDRVPN